MCRELWFDCKFSVENLPSVSGLRGGLSGVSLSAVPGLGRAHSLSAADCGTHGGVSTTLPIEEEVALGPLTTLRVGGPARFLARCRSLEELSAVLAWARQRRIPVLPIGGGSNLLVSDEGFDGLCLQWREDSMSLGLAADGVEVSVGGGADWDVVVERTVEEGLGGIECLSGIPGLAGAAPVQNIGAYGQEVGERLQSVQVVELETGITHWLEREELGLGYRTSRFKGAWRGRYLITRLKMHLPRSPEGTVRYPELRRRLGLEEGSGGAWPSPGAVRGVVLEIRREKSMVLDSHDPNRRSAGSFFVNPVVDDKAAEAVFRRVRERGIEGPVPAYPAGSGHHKLSAAWLIERAGFSRGWARGPAGLSSRHTLALINRGGATAADLLAAAREIRRGVLEAFGVGLVPEPVFIGFDASVETLLGEP